MNLKYINIIKGNISIYSNKKTNNILDGTYKSIYMGKSMNFENLREYVINDDIKDIDWKVSARSGKLYIKQFIAEKKHNILLVIDNNIGMGADTDKLENKKEIALITAGTIGYIAIKNNDYVGMIYKNSEKIKFQPFKYNLYDLEKYLCEFDLSIPSENDNINDTLEYICKNINKKMIIFVITDINGIENIKSKTLKKINQKNNLLIININDNYMYGNNIYDINENKYIPKFLTNNKRLYDIEKKVKEEILLKNTKKFKKNSTNIVSISSRKEINFNLIKLLEEHKYANTNRT